MGNIHYKYEKNKLTILAFDKIASNHLPMPEIVFCTSLRKQNHKAWSTVNIV